MTTRAQAAASPMPIMMNGIQYMMSPLADFDLGALDNWVRGEVIKAAQASVPTDAPQEQHDKVFDRALRVSITVTWASETGAAMLGTVPGMAQFIWQGIRGNHPEMTVAAVEKAIVTDPNAIAEGMNVFKTLNDTVQKKRASKKELKNRNKNRARKKTERQNKKQQRAYQTT